MPQFAQTAGGGQGQAVQPQPDSLQGGAAGVPWALWHQDPNPSSSRTCWHGSMGGAGEQVKQIQVITHSLILMKTRGDWVMEGVNSKGMKQALPKAGTASEAASYCELVWQPPLLPQCLGQQDKCPCSVSATPAAAEAVWRREDALAENVAATVLK